MITNYAETFRRYPTTVPTTTIYTGVLLRAFGAESAMQLEPRFASMSLAGCVAQMCHEVNVPFESSHTTFDAVSNMWSVRDHRTVIVGLIYEQVLQGGR